MVGIAAVNIAAGAFSATSARDGAGAQKTEEATAGTRADLSKVTGTGQVESAQSSEGSSESLAVQELRAMIKELQRRLAEEQKQLAQLMASKMEETEKAAAVSAKQASIATITGQLLTATAKLLEALTQSGSSSAGGTVDTQA